MQELVDKLMAMYYNNIIVKIGVEMPRITKTQCWDILEDRLMTISENRIGGHIAECKLAIAVIVSAGRDNDMEWVDSEVFKFYCKAACLNEKLTAELLQRSINYLNEGGTAKFRQAMLEV